MPCESPVRFEETDIGLVEVVDVVVEEVALDPRAEEVPHSNEIANPDKPFESTAPLMVADAPAIEVAGFVIASGAILTFVGVGIEVTDVVLAHEVCTLACGTKPAFEEPTVVLPTLANAVLV